MKKAFLSIVCIIVFLLDSYSQVNSRTIGARLGGDGQTNGAEVSYQHGLGDANRLELDFGLRSRRYYNNLFAAGIYHWVWNITEGLNWYAGPGAIAGFYNWNDNVLPASSGLNIGVGGQIGIEYDFQELDVPLLVSLDARPMFNVTGYTNGFGWGAALGIRYIWK